jgi:hypothetical protein
MVSAPTLAKTASKFGIGFCAKAADATLRYPRAAVIQPQGDRVRAIRSASDCL